jgi:hypothetical protein
MSLYSIVSNQHILNNSFNNNIVLQSHPLLQLRITMLMIISSYVKKIQCEIYVS